MSKAKLLSFIIIVPLLWNCTKADEPLMIQELAPIIINDPALADRLRTSPEQVSLANHNFKIKVDLYRNFELFSPANGRRMDCSLAIEDKDSLGLPNNISTNQIFVVQHDSIWFADVENEHFDQPWRLEGGVYNGPKWAPESFADVICEFSVDGLDFLILAKNVEITRLD